MLTSGDEGVFEAIKWVGSVFSYFENGKKQADEAEEQIKLYENEPE